MAIALLLFVQFKYIRGLSQFFGQIAWRRFLIDMTWRVVLQFSRLCLRCGLVIARSTQNSPGLNHLLLNINCYKSWKLEYLTIFKIFFFCVVPCLLCCLVIAHITQNSPRLKSLTIKNMKNKAGVKNSIKFQMKMLFYILRFASIIDNSFNKNMTKFELNQTIL